MFVAVAHTVSSQYPLLHCYSFPAPITPPPHCGVGAAAPEAGAGWAVKLLVRVYCVSPRSHTHPSPLTISHHHITTSPHHIRGLTGRGRARAPWWRCPGTHLRASPCCACLPEQLSATTAPCSRQPGQPGTLGRILLAECSRTQPPQLAS